MIMKKKSFFVVLISSIVISMVLVVNLAGYLIYLEMKDHELDAEYRVLLHKINARIYARHIEVARLGASIERTGPLSGKPVLEGIIRNDGTKDITDLVLRVRLLDKDGAVMYQVVFHPQEPAFGSSYLVGESLPHSSASSVGAIRPENSLPFKIILSDCPKEIIAELKRESVSPGRSGMWSGRIDYEIVSLYH